MSYFETNNIQSADSPSVDAFGRWRVSNPDATFDNKQLYGDNGIVWSTLIVGNATASFYTNNASMILTAAGNPSSIVRQTKRRYSYQPGKSQLITITGNISGSSPNCIKRIGYFDQNNGIYFTTSGSSFGVGIRTKTSGTPVDTFITQSAWNLDKFDGTGASGKSPNLSASQIFFADFEWLGAGRVRYGIYQSGVPTYVHQITNTNTLPSVFISSPNQPIRCEIINSGSSPTSMLQICSAVVSEGGTEDNGTIRSVSNGASSFTITAGSYSAMLAIRLKSGSLDGGVIPLKVDSGNSSGAGFAAFSCYEVTILYNPTTSSAWLWQDLPNSIIQYATSSAINSITNDGTRALTIVGGGGSAAGIVNADKILAIGSDVTGSQDTLVVGYRCINTDSTNAVAALTWREV